MKGGKPFASGGYGCAFKPALTCPGETPLPNGISKLMKKHHMKDEMAEYNRVRKFTDDIPNSANYFLFDGITSCSPPERLSSGDLTDFFKCRNLTRHGIDADNVNDNLRNLGAPSFFQAPAPSPADHGGLSTRSDVWWARYREACAEWWRVNDVVYGLIEDSVRIDGRHFDGDYEALRKHKSNGTMSAHSLLAWLNAHFDDQTRSRRRCFWPRSRRSWATTPISRINRINLN